MLERTETHAQFVAAELNFYIAGPLADITAIRSLPPLAALIRARLAGGADPIDGFPEQVMIDRISSRVVSEFKAKPAYAELQVFGLDGSWREILRVDRSGPDGAIRVVAAPGPESRVDQPYFANTVSDRKSVV